MCRRIEDMCDAEIVSDREVQMVSKLKTVFKFGALYNNINIRIFAISR
jgi:hypothetical protein